MVAAWQRGQRIVGVSAAVDVWAFGVIGYELLARELWCAGLSQEQMVAAISTEGQLPWEAATKQEQAALRKALRRKLQRLAPIVLSCLARLPDERPKAAELVTSLDSLFHTMTTGSTTMMPVLFALLYNSLPLQISKCGSELCMGLLRSLNSV